MITRQKRIVFTTWGSYGDLHPYMALAAELRTRGRHCVIATSEIYREKVEAAGFEFHAVRPDLPAPDSEEAAEMIGRVSRNFSGPAFLFNELLVPHIRATYEDTLAAIHGADILVSHQVPLTAPIIAETSGIKWVSCVLFPIAFASIHDPPTPPQFPAIRPLVAAHRLIAELMMGIGKWTMEWWVEPIQTLRAELGLKRSAHPIFEGQHSPTQVLGLFSTLMSKVQPDFPRNCTITGFPFYDEPESPSSTELLQFLDDGDPPILFTLGSSLVWSAGDFYKVSIEAAKRLGRRAILLVGDMKNIGDLGLPDSIAAFEYAPHSQVMPRACAIVHPGGIGTTAQALRAGKPMLILPHGQDQPDNARRCVELGVACSIRPSEYRVDRVVNELSRLFEMANYSRRAEEAARVVKAENGTKTACDLIEEVLKK